LIELIELTWTAIGRPFFLRIANDYRTLVCSRTKMHLIGDQAGRALDFFMDDLQNRG
jgi:hypothetical protein